MEVAVISLSIACALLSLSTVLLASTLPWLWWKCFRLEEKVLKLDEVLSSLLEVTGVRVEESKSKEVR